MLLLLVKVSLNALNVSNLMMFGSNPNKCIALPFLEFDLARQLMLKLKIIGRNAGKHWLIW